MPRLATIPDAAAQATRVARDPDSTLQDLSAAFAADAAMCAQLLKVANSAYYGQRAEVATIARAAAVLGRRVLQNVAVAASIQAIVRKTSGGASRSAQLLWGHAVRTAAGASELARTTKAWESAEAFSAGLMHDLGMLVELERDGDALFGFVAALSGLEPGLRSRALREREIGHYGASHEHFGAALCESWGFPAALREAIAFHHDPLAAGNAPNLAAGVDARPLAAIVNVADAIDEAFDGTTGFDPAAGIHVDPSVLGLIGLEAEDLPELADRLHRVGVEAEVGFA